MAVLTTEQRAAEFAAFMVEESAACRPVGGVKDDGAAALDAIDDWVEANVASFLAAIPEPASSTYSARQKIRLLARVVRARWEVT